MSSEAVSWVVREGMRNLPARLVGPLIIIAEGCDFYGEGARPWVTDHWVRGEVLPRDGLATLCGISVRRCRQRLAELEARGVIQRGDQRRADFVRADRRPVVWDIPGVRQAYIARSSGLLR